MSEKPKLEFGPAPDRRVALAAGHYEVAEQDGLPFDLDRLNEELLEEGLQPFTAMSELLQAVQEWRTFEAPATLAILKPPKH